jgi:hypothetical protein
MNRGEPLQWGISIDTDGTRWNVTLAGAHRPDWTFDSFEALIEWLEDQNEGLKIGRMMREAPHGQP